MAKSTISLDDNFIFKFPKKYQDPTSAEESDYPVCQHIGDYKPYLEEI